MKRENRNTYLDFVKAVLIFLVLLGHTIQMVSYKNEGSFWDDYLFKFIYIFHMPLSIGISGYFTYFSVQKYSFVPFMKNKIIYLALPTLSWCLIAYLPRVLLGKELSLYKFITFSLSSYWFVWAVLLFSIITAGLAFLKVKNNILILFLSAVALLIFPFEYFSFPLIRSMFPFFIFGYILPMLNVDKIISYLKKYLVVVLLISVLCYLYWNKDIYPYITPSSLFDMNTLFFRLIASVSLSILVLFVLYFIHDKLKQGTSAKIVVGIGANTLGIYLIQELFFKIYLKIYGHTEAVIYNYIVDFIIALVLLFAFYYFIVVVSKVNFLGTVLFGKKIR